MTRHLLIIYAFLLLCLGLTARAQTQVVANGAVTTKVSGQSTGCIYTWINNNPAIGLPASGVGDIPGFTAVNIGSVNAYGTVTASPVTAALAFVPNGTKSRIEVINTANNNIINSIQLATPPKNMAFSPDRTRMYVTGTNRLYIVDLIAQQVIDSVAVGDFTNGLVVSPDGKRVYIGRGGVNGVLGGVTVVNVSQKPYATGQININYDASVYVGIAQKLVLNADGSKLYVSVSLDSIVPPPGPPLVVVPVKGFVSVIKTFDNSVITTIPQKKGTYGMILNGAGTKLYVANSASNKITVVSTITNVVTDSITVGVSPSDMVLSPDGATLYVTNSADRSLSIINTATNALLRGPVTLNNQHPIGISITPDGSKLYIFSTIGSIITQVSTDFFNSTNINIGATAFTPWFGNFITPLGSSCSLVTVNYIITPTPTTPTIVTSGTPAALTTNAGTASVAASFGVSAYKLTEGLKVTAPAGFEISTDNTSFSNTLIIGTGGDIADTKIYIRLPASDAVGSYSGNVKITSAGAPDVILPITGSVSPTGSVMPNITVYNGDKISDIKLPGIACYDSWSADKPGIGLKNGMGFSKIPSFIANNPGTTPISTTVSVALVPKTKIVVINARLSYIVNQITGKAWIYNLDKDNYTVAAFNTGAEPYGIALNAERSMAYVTNHGDGTVSLAKLTYEVYPDTIGPLNPIILSPINLGGKTKKPEGIVVTPDGSFVYVANSGDGTVSVINTVNNTVIKTISLGTLTPCGVAISPDGSKVYVTSTGSNSISVISTATNTVIATIATGVNPQGITINADGSKLYVANQGSNSVSVINTADNSSTTINVGSKPLGICISLDGSRVYVANQGSNDISVISTSANAEIKRIAVGQMPSGISVSPDGGVVYVCCLNDADVYMVNTGSFAVTKFDGSNNGGDLGPFSFGNFIDGPVGCVTPFTFTITILPTPPSLSADGYLANLTTSQGVTSAITRFNISGLSLSEGILVTPPAGYEVSADSVNFSKTITIGAAGNITAAPVFVRLAASTVAGTYPGDITLSSAGATSVPEPVNGTVTAAVPAIIVTPVTGSIKGCAGYPSTSMQQFNVSAVALRGILTAHAPTGIEISLSPTTGFAADLDISSLADVPSTTIYVRAALTATGRLSGNVKLSSAGILPGVTVGVFGVAYANPTINQVGSLTIVAGGKPSLPVGFTGTGNTYKWFNDKPEINLGASGTGDIAPFVGINNTNSDIVATVTAIPVSTTLIYVTNQNDNSVSVIDVATNVLIATIPVGSSPQGLFLTPDGTRLYVANTGDGTVTVINTGDNSKITTINVGQSPLLMGLSADGSILTVYNSYDNTYTTINTDTYAVIETKNTGTVTSQSSSVSPDGTLRYSTEPLSEGLVHIYDTKTGKQVNTIQVGNWPVGLSLTPDGKTLYVANAYSDYVSVINTETNEVIAQVPTAHYPSAVVATGGTGCSGNAITFTITVKPVPPIIVVKGKLDSLGTIQGNPSRSTSFTVSGTRMQDVIKATAPIGFEVSTDNINFSNSITFGASGTIASTTVYVRIAAATAVGNWSGNVSLSSQAAESVTMPTYASNNVTEPVSSVVVGFVSGNIAACAGSPSASPNVKQFKASGYLLTSDITVTAPQGFEVSVNALGGYSSTLTLSHIADSVPHTTIYVRSAASALGSISGSVSLSAAGATIRNVPVTGVVSPIPTVDPVKDQSLPGDQITTPVTFTGTGNAFTWASDNTSIGMAASGYASIPAFKAINTGNIPVVANVTVTPIAAAMAYIANNASSSISVINTGSNTVVRKIQLALNSNPTGVAVSPDGTKVYVTDQAINSVTVIDAISNTPIKTFIVGVKPSGIVISPDGSTLYVANNGADNIAIFDANSYKVIANVIVGNNPAGITISPDGKMVYVAVRNASAAANRIAAINTNTLIKTYYSAGAAPEQVALSPDGGTLYVANYGGLSISVINLATSVSSTINLTGSPEGLVVSPDGKTLYVANATANTVAAITLATKTIIYISVGKSPQGVSLNADGSVLFVTNAGANSVSVINTVTNKVTTITGGIDGTPVSYGNFISAGTACPGNPVTFKYIVNPSSPYVSYTETPNSLATIYGTPSGSTSISVSGISMAAGITVTPPAGFEVSLDNKTFSSTVSLGAAGTITATKVYIRLAAATPVNTYTGNIVLSSQGATDMTVSMPNSIVSPASLTITADNKSKTVGAANPTLTATYSGFVNQETSQALTTSPLLSTVATQSSPVGQYPILVSGAVSTNYTFTYIPGILTVNLGEQGIAIPNAFTPNGDGVNDTWEIPALATYKNFTVNIFNRQGQNLYYSNNYPTPWDGTYNGVPLPTGVYYYIINIKGAAKPFAGNVTIIR